MTHKNDPPPLRRLFPLLLIFIFLLTPGCGLLDGSDEPETVEPAMSLEEALDTTPLDGRPTVLEELGPPDAFTIQFKELNGQIVRWESWSYFDFTTQFDFIDGELIWRIDIEPVPDGSFYAHFYDPLELTAGMSQAEVESLFPEIDFWEIPLDAIDLEDGIALAGEQIFLGFYEDELVYVETVILSPDPDGKPLPGIAAEPTGEEPTPAPTQEPTLAPTQTPAPEPAAPKLVSFEDTFDSALAIPLFTESIMEYGVFDGEGAFTGHFLGGVLLAYYQEPELADFILEIDVRPMNFAEGSKAGIVFRSEYPAGGANYYQMISIIPNKGQIEFQTWLGGEWAQTETHNIPSELIPPFGVYKLKIECLGERILIYLSDELAAEFSSTLILEPGYFGLSMIAARDPETVLFDNLDITEHP